MSRLGRMLAWLAIGAACVGLLVVVPLALARFGLPIIDAGMHADALRRSDRVGAAVDITLAVLVGLFGLLWCLSVWWFVAIAVAEVRGSNPSLPFSGPLRPLLLRAVGTISLLVIQPTRVPSSAAATSTPVIEIEPASADDPALESPGLDVDLVHPDDQAVKWVKAGSRDSWASLAERHLGSWRRWEEVRSLTLEAHANSSIDLDESAPAPGQVAFLPADATGANEGAPPQPDAAPTYSQGFPADQAPAVSEAAHTVERGDSFWKIAKATLAEATGRTPTDAEVDRYHDEMIERNRDRLVDGGNPDLIFPAQQLVTPDPVAPANKPAEAAESAVGDGARGGGDTELPDAHMTSPYENSCAPQTPVLPPSSVTGTSKAPDTTLVGGAPTSADRPGSRTNTTVPTDGGDGPGLRPQRRVTLPSGVDVGIGFAVGVAFTFAVGSINRRRAYRPERPRPGAVGENTLPEPLPTLLNAATGAASAATDGVPSFSSNDDHRVPLDPVARGAVHVVGDAGLEVARGIVIGHLLQQENMLTPYGSAITDRATAEALFGAAVPVPGLGVFATETDLLDEAEIERARRVRIVGEASDIAEYRASDGDELLSDLLVVGTATAENVGRWAALASACGRLGIGSVLVGGLDAGGLTVDAGSARDDGVGGSSAPFDRLSQDDARVLLSEIAVARTAPPAPAPRPIDEPFPFEEAEQAASPVGEASVTVKVFGRVRVAVDGRDVLIRDAGSEPLAFWVSHPGPQRRDVVIDAVWPEIDFEKGKYTFKNALRSLREDVWSILGREDLPVVESAIVESKRSGGSAYQLQPGLLDADLWHFQAALRDAERATATEERLALLRKALEWYGGEFVEGSGALWVIGMREDLRRRALDAAVTIAELEEDAGNLEAAVLAVQRAVELDVYAEDLYVRGVRLFAALGRIESARKLFAALQRELAEFGRSPMPATSEAINRAISDAERRRSARDSTAHQAFARSSGGADPSED